MSDKVHNVLFLCTHNSARSIMAEALLNHLGAGRFKGYSAGSQPGGSVNPWTLKTLAGWRVETEGLRSKGWEEFSQPGAPAMDFVITVCDSAAAEVCPVWPGQPLGVHWGVADPSAVEGSDVKKAQAFLDAAITLRRRVELMLALPLPALDQLTLQREMSNIGSR